ncbi:transposase [Rhizobium leguminosarum]|nr:transposase [Rhizobium leguminosarum]TAV56069.1 transposase [Rhizobium leguminosarum]
MAQGRAGRTACPPLDKRVCSSDRCCRAGCCEHTTCGDCRCAAACQRPRSHGVLKHDPLGGHLFCFRGRRGDLVKLIWHDGQGACLFTKKLERGRFIWPNAEGGAVAITPAQLSYLLSGIDWRAPQETWRPTRV